MGQIDVLYMTRVQKERFPTQAEYDAVKDVFKITPETMAMVRGVTCVHALNGNWCGGVWDVCDRASCRVMLDLNRASRHSNPPDPSPTPPHPTPQTPRARSPSC